MFDQEQFRTLVQARRKAQGLTQEQLGSALGVSAQAVSKWELGESTPDIALLPALCRALGTSADALLGVDSGLGLETLSGTLVDRLAKQQADEQTRSLMRVLARLHCLRQSGYDSLPPDGPESLLDCAYHLHDDALTRLQVYAGQGFAAIALEPLLSKAEPRPELLAQLRALLAPGHWEVVLALLSGPKKVDELGESLPEQSAEAVRATLQALIDAGLLVQERAGYQLDHFRGLALAGVLRVLSALPNTGRTGMSHSHGSR